MASDLGRKICGQHPGRRTAAHGARPHQPAVRRPERLRPVRFPVKIGSNRLMQQTPGRGYYFTIRFPAGEAATQATLDATVTSVRFIDD
jgi:hypothetical protein